MNVSFLSGSLYADMVRNGAANLNKNRTYVNDLNVFPVPDGDTGDNMYLTIDSGAHAVKEADYADLSVVADAIAKGMLLGARGNSGVILSRIFAGIAKNLEGVSEASVEMLGKSFVGSIREAYSAVSKPVEGTILSVYRDAVQFANDNLTGESTFDSFFSDFVAELHRSLDRTPELLHVLKEAGVVDSGGAGFVYIAEGMQSALAGEKIEDASEKPAAGNEVIDFDAFTEDSELTYGYCTEFLLRLQNKKCDIANFDIDGFTAYLNSVGNSVVSFQEGSIVKVHVHTMNPGEILNYCQQYGEYLKLKIENMNLQHNEQDVDTPAGKADAPRVKKHKKYGVVTVANGEGLVNLFKELGADEVVEGGQSMNPSAGSFLAAFKELNCDDIIVLPNNSNIILTAVQAASLYEEKPVHIVKTRTLGEGYAVLSMMDTENPDVDAFLEECESSKEGVVTGMISKATRDTVMDGVQVREGDYIGFTDDEILVDSSDIHEAALGLAEKAGAGDYDILLIIRGGSTSTEEAEQLRSELEDLYSGTEVILLDGLQPIYDYIMVLE